MFNWITSWWKTNPRSIPGPVLGPARNAPNNGLNIKSFLEQQSNLVATNVVNNNNQQPIPPKKSTSQNVSVQFVSVSANDIQAIRARLNKVPTKLNKSETQEPPLLREMNEIFSQGNEGYFASIKLRREQKHKEFNTIKVKKVAKRKVINPSRGQKMRDAHYAGIKRAEEEAVQRAEREIIRRIEKDAQLMKTLMRLELSKEYSNQMEENIQRLEIDTIKMLASDPTQKDIISTEEEWANHFNIPLSPAIYMGGWDDENLIFDDTNFLWTQEDLKGRFESSEISGNDIIQARDEWNNKFLTPTIPQISMIEPTPTIIPTSLGLDVSFTMALHGKIENEIKEFVAI